MGRAYSVQGLWHKEATEPKESLCLPFLQHILCGSSVPHLPCLNHRQAGRAFPALLREQGEVTLRYSKAQRLPQHLLLRLLSLGLNSCADYNELQNLLILGRKELKKPNYIYKGILLSFGLDLYLSWLLSWSPGHWGWNYPSDSSYQKKQCWSYQASEGRLQMRGATPADWIHFQILSFLHPAFALY